MLIRLALFTAAACALAPAQTITSLQASQNGSPPANVTSVAGGSPLPSGFTIYVNAAAGTWDPAASANINWNNPLGVSGTIEAEVSGDGSQVSGVVPFPFFSSPVATSQPVSISVTEITTSTTLIFNIVPKPVALGPSLPAALIGVPYSTPIAQYGTPPFTVSTLPNGPPTGLSLDLTVPRIVGTAAGPPGLSTVAGALLDFWGNLVSFSDKLQVVGTPPISAVTSSAGASFAYGTTTSLSVTLQPYAIPTYLANVQFRDGATSLGIASIDPISGVATLPAVFLGTGTHSAISATFLGDANWQSVTSPTSTITVTQATPSFSLLGNPFTATYGGTLSFGTITVIGAALPAVQPTGTLTLTSGSTTLGTFAVSGVITLTGTHLPASLNAGAQPLTFNYPGDANYTAAGTAGVVNIAKATPSTALSLSPNPVTAGQNERMSATVASPTLGTPTGTVTFLDGSAPLAGGTVSLAAGAAAFNTTALATGFHSIQFSYSGDTNFLPATSTAQGLTVSPAALAITTSFLPGGTVFQTYSAAITAAGGYPPYTYSATGLPPGLSIDARTGIISGTPGNSGTFTPTFTVTDSASLIVDGPNSSVSRQLTLSILSPPVRISQFASLPDGVVGVGYSGTVGAAGGVSPISFAVTRGNVPPGLTFFNSGLLTGVPTTIGKYSFTVTVTDAGNTSDSRDFTVTIAPPPLSIGGSASLTMVLNTPQNVSMGCGGGVGPYTYSATGSLPPGISFGNCAFSGTPTSLGTFLVHITITDSTGASLTKDVTITVVPPNLTFSGGPLPNGRVGVAYSASVIASGGVPPISYSGSGLPDGLSLASSGAISGTPTTAGQFSIQVTATDSSKGAAPASVSATFSITILPPTLAFGPASLPDGTVGVAYSGSVTATGGTKPYSFSLSGLPDGLTASAAGSVTGTPTTAGTFTVSATVSDAAGGTAAQTYTIKIAPPALSITTTSAPNGTVGTPYSAAFAASGGTQPYTFSATGQPQGLTMSSSGTLSGTPQSAGTFSVAVTVKDSTGATAGKTVSITIVLPPAPPLNFGGVSATVGPLQQPRVTVSLATPYPVDVLATLTLTSKPDSGPPDPAVVFVTGGTTATITIPAGSLNGATDVGVQTGSVAGTITITAKLTASGSDVTPSPAPNTTIRVAAAAPVLTSVTATRTATGFTVTIAGYVTDREVTTGNFTFSGTNLGTTSLTVPVDAVFAVYFGGTSPPSAPYGGQFSYAQQFTVTGSNTAITSVTVTLTNKIGTSNSLSANLN